jgi:hypothetical protein
MHPQMSRFSTGSRWFLAMINGCGRHAVLLTMLSILVVLALPLVPSWAVLLSRLLLLAAFVGLIPKVIGVVRHPKPFLFSVVAILVGAGLAYGVLEVFSFAWLKLRHRNPANPFVLTAVQRDSVQRMLDDAPDYYVFSSSLGWAPGINRVSEDGLAKTNAAGIRADREYTKSRPSKVIRVLCFGDSYVHGDEVGNAETWPHFAELAQRGMEFLNFGVGGYGVTQSLVRYEETASQYETDVVILGCMTDDLRRSLNVYYPFRLSNPADAPSATMMPYASLDDQGGLVIQPPYLSSKEDYADFLDNPGPKLKEIVKLDPLFKSAPATPLLALIADSWANGDSSRMEAGVRYLGSAASRVLNLKEGRYRTTEQKLRDRIHAINCAIFERFAAAAKQRNHRPLILWFPSPKDLENQNQGKKRSYQRYLDHLSQNNIPFVDTLDWLLEIHRGHAKLPIQEVLKVGHFSAATNKKIGGRIASHVLQMTQPTPPAK